jgi:hypothetical protein
MSKIVRVQDSNYKLVVGSPGNPGTITFDTNFLGNQGKVVIVGDLDIQGKTTIIESENLAIKDNIIVLNQNEQLDGVKTLGSTAGISIERGTLPDVSILWDERTNQFVFVDSSYVDASDLSTAIQGIATNRIDTGGNDLNLITQGTGIINVTGTLNYERQILDYDKLNTVYEISTISRINNIATITTSAPHTIIAGGQVDIFVLNNSTFDTLFATVVSVPDAGSNAVTLTYRNEGPDLATSSATGTVRPNPVKNDDAIPNIRAIVDYTNRRVFSTNKIQEGDTKVQVFDTNQTGLGEIVFDVDAFPRVVVNNSGLTADNIRLESNSISNISTNVLLLDSVLNLKNAPVSYNPSQESNPGYVKFYSKNEVGGGGTGLYFVNTQGTNDELISKRRAIVYSLIF